MSSLEKVRLGRRSTCRKLAIVENRLRKSFTSSRKTTVLGAILLTGYLGRALGWQTHVARGMIRDGFIAGHRSASSVWLGIFSAGFALASIDSIPKTNRGCERSNDEGGSDGFPYEC